MNWLWVNLPYATFGVRVREGSVVEAAPIGRWMVGKPEGYVRRWVARKGGRVQSLK